MTTKVVVQKLLPCPFCGSNDIDINSANHNNGKCYWVQCNECGVETRATDIGSEKLQNVARDIWNKRVK